MLLRTTKMSSIEIANSLSFSSQSYFIKVFLDVMGITPQKYRGNSSAEFEKRTRA
ncbi:MAG: helix-turn-helix domain-containing protein [Christensenellaceae bacterium]